MLAEPKPEHQHVEGPLTVPPRIVNQDSIREELWLALNGQIVDWPAGCQLF